MHLTINAHFSSFFDVFFKYFSKLAPIIFIIGIVTYVLKKETYKTLIILCSAYVLNFIIATFVKRAFFIHVHRPTYYFEQKGIDLHLIDGVFSQIPYTFPSGHTADAFLLMLFISMLSKSKWIQLLTIILAILMAFSRMYLSKHFMIDTIGGAFLGTFMIILSLNMFQKKNSLFMKRKIYTK